MPQTFKELQPALHPVYARLLCAEMQRRGFSPDSILEGTSLQWQALHQSNQFLNFDQMRRLIRRGLSLSECPWLGLEVGLRTQASAHGTLGAAMIASSDLPKAMLLLQRYAGLRQNLATLAFEHEPVFAAVLKEWVDLGDVREYLHCQLLGGLVQLLTAMTGQDLPGLLHIEWPFEPPAWAEQYARISHSNSFGAPHLRVVMDQALVQSPSLAADEAALQRLLRDCDLQLQHQLQGGSLCQRVRLALQQTEGAMPTLRAMAARENMTERTFMRHLQAEGSSYQTLLDEVRKERAAWLLHNTEKTVEEIALALGYEDPSNFSRTFRRWFGESPRNFKQMD
ncbi:MAG TPA: AraC family transcriptional regulator ligand-binding domain-containing protein [Limnobacter sp.]|nr:AraC family transcriptional regulator ligand-binding domain-containing protein [Limnobacter sp.]